MGSHFYPQFKGKYSSQHFREMKQNAPLFRMHAHAHRTALDLQDHQALL